jgi:DNA-3-methyladenine glycosylase
MSKLLSEFYQREDVVQISKDLLGKKLCTFIDQRYTSGIITEVEAYSGRNDKACHANDGRRTPRTEIMYQQGGFAYVYLCYGIHHLFNVVTNKAGLADAILVRAIEPIDGLEIMLERRKIGKATYSLTTGPGSMSQALGITTKQYGTDLSGNLIWIEDAAAIPEDKILATTRIGVQYAAEHASYPWRFVIKGNPWISKWKP